MTISAASVRVEQGVVIVGETSGGETSIVIDSISAVSLHPPAPQASARAADGTLRTKQTLSMRQHNGFTVSLWMWFPATEEQPNCLELEKAYIAIRNRLMDNGGRKTIWPDVDNVPALA